MNWYPQHFCKPVRSHVSSLSRKSSNSAFVSPMIVLSFKIPRIHLPRNLIGFSHTLGMISPPRLRLCSLTSSMYHLTKSPASNTRALDFDDLSFHLAHRTNSWN